MFRGRIKITGEIADFNTFKNKDGETMVQKDGTLSFFRPEEVENVEQLCWHPASELPPVDENGNSPELIAITSDGMLMRVYFHQESKEYSFWVESDDWNKQARYGVNVKWWCYPPRKE